jgi:long-chain acyl-CoA synthetase
VRHLPEIDTVAAIPGAHAGRTPDLTAIRCADRELSYRQLRERSDLVARAIVAAGLVPGTRIAYLGNESVDYYATVFGCARSGTVLVPINFRLSPAEVDHILRDSGSVLLFADPGFPVGQDVPGLTTVDTGRFDDWLAGTSDHNRLPTTGPDDPVVQLYTSGTTGLPKGVVLAGRSFFAVRDALWSAGLDWIDWHAGDRSLIGIPGFHVGGIWWAMQGFSAGITNVAMPRFDATGAVRLISELGVTTACVVPSMLRLMLTEPGVDRSTFASLRKIVYGGSPISETLLRAALPVFDCDFAQIYGLTETGNTAVCLPPADHRPDGPRLRAAGKPYPCVSVKVIDFSGAEVPTGTVGEVCLRTPARMVEYWGMPEATEQALVDGWIHTGDGGYLDEDGYVFIQDRLKDMIIVGGENIYPTEIENVLTKHPAVADAAVIGVPDDRFGESVRAFVALRPGHHARGRDLMVFCAERIGTFKIPAVFEFVDTVPRNPSGKILRRELRARFWADRDRQVN